MEVRLGVRVQWVGGEGRVTRNDGNKMARTDTGDLQHVPNRQDALHGIVSFAAHSIFVTMPSKRSIFFFSKHETTEGEGAWWKSVSKLAQLCCKAWIHMITLRCKLTAKSLVGIPQRAHDLHGLGSSPRDLPCGFLPRAKITLSLQRTSEETHTQTVVSPTPANLESVDTRVSRGSWTVGLQGWGGGDGTHSLKAQGRARERYEPAAVHNAMSCSSESPKVCARKRSAITDSSWERAKIDHFDES